MYFYRNHHASASLYVNWHKMSQWYYLSVLGNAIGSFLCCIILLMFLLTVYHSVANFLFILLCFLLKGEVHLLQHFVKSLCATQKKKGCVNAIKPYLSHNICCATYYFWFSIYLSVKKHSMCVCFLEIYFPSYFSAVIL